MDKKERKSLIGYAAIVAGMVSQLIDEPGIISIGLYLDRRKPGIWYVPGVFLQTWKFMEVFGPDTNYEYLTDRDGDMQVVTDVEGVMFYATISPSDLIEDGRLVA